MPIEIPADDLIEKLDNYELTESESQGTPYKILGDSGLNTLYKGCRKSQKARKKFIHFIANENWDNLEKKDQTITLEKLLTKEGKKLYKAALEEEYKSRAFREAVLIASTDVYSGPKLKETVELPIVGPSGAGKSYVLKESVKASMQVINPSNVVSDENKNYVIAIDGAVERKMSQVRQQVVQLALACGYREILDLEPKEWKRGFTEEKKIKKHIKSAIKSSQNNLIVVKPITCIASNTKNVKENSPRVCTEVVGLDPKQFKKQVQYSAQMRSRAPKNFKPSNKIMPNNRTIPYEMKAYQPENYDRGYKNSLEEAMKLQEKGIYCQVAINQRVCVKQNENTFLVDYRDIQAWGILQRNGAQDARTALEALLEPPGSPEIVQAWIDAWNQSDKKHKTWYDKVLTLRKTDLPIVIKKVKYIKDKHGDVKRVFLDATQSLQRELEDAVAERKKMFIDAAKMMVRFSKKDRTFDIAIFDKIETLVLEEEQDLSAKDTVALLIVALQKHDQFKDLDQKKIQKQLKSAENMLNWFDEEGTARKQPLKTVSELDGYEITQIETPLSRPTLEQIKQMQTILKASKEDPKWFSNLYTWEKKYFKKAFLQVFEKAEVDIEFNFDNHASEEIDKIQDAFQKYVGVPPSTVRKYPFVPNYATSQITLKNLETNKTVEYTTHSRSGIIVPYGIKSDSDRIEKTVDNIEQIIENELDAKIKQIETDFGMELKDNMEITIPVLLQTLITPLPSPVGDSEDKMLTNKKQAIRHIREKCKTKRSITTKDGKTIYIGFDFVETNHPINSFRNLETSSRYSAGRASLAACRFIQNMINHLSDQDKQVFQSKSITPKKLIQFNISDLRNKSSKSSEAILKKIEAIQPLLEKLQSLEDPKKNRGLDKERIHLQRAVYEKMLISKCGGISTGSCKSGKDREGTESLMISAVTIFHHRYNHYPNLNEKETNHQKDREKFKKIFDHLCETKHNEKFAALSAKGANGIKKMDTFLPKWLRAGNKADIKASGKRAGLNKLSLSKKNIKKANEKIKQLYTNVKEVRLIEQWETYYQFWGKPNKIEKSEDPNSVSVTKEDFAFEATFNEQMSEMKTQVTKLPEGKEKKRLELEKFIQACHAQGLEDIEIETNDPALADMLSEICQKNGCNVINQTKPEKKHMRI